MSAAKWLPFRIDLNMFSLIQYMLSYLVAGLLDYISMD